VVASKGLCTDTIRVSWKSSAGADGYLIYRSTDSTMAAATLRGATAKDVLFWNDTVHTDSLYYYSVKAFNSGGESVLSRMHGSGFRKPAQAPGVPTNLAATKNNLAAVVLSWQPPVSGCQPSQYRIYRATSQNGAFALIATTPERTYQDPVPATYPSSYWYKISGVNDTGEGPQCAAVEGYRN
jgi:fibronectin type 3 domain-containing protein